MSTKRGFDSSVGMKLGAGYDALADEVRAVVVQGQEGESIGGKSVEAYVEQVDEIADFLEYIGISASVGLRAGIGNVSAKTKFAKTLKMHQFNLYIVVYIKVIIGTRQLNDEKFSPEFLGLLSDPAGQEQFRRQFGDEYLATITSGGEFYAVIEIRARSRSEHQELKGKIAGSFAGATGDVRLQKSLHSVNTAGSLRILYNQSGGTEFSLPLSPEELLVRAKEFPNTITDTNKYDFEASFRSYDTVPRGVEFNPLRIQHRRDSLEKYGRLRLKYQEKIEAADYILFHAEEFEAFDADELTQRRNKLSDTMDRLTEDASKCFNSVDQCDMPTIDNPIISFPKRLASIEIESIEEAARGLREAEQSAAVCKTTHQRLINIRVAAEATTVNVSLMGQAKSELMKCRAANLKARDAKRAVETAATLAGALGATKIRKTVEKTKAEAILAESGASSAEAEYKKLLDLYYLVRIRDHTRWILHDLNNPQHKSYWNSIENAAANDAGNTFTGRKFYQRLHDHSKYYLNSLGHSSWWISINKAAITDRQALII